jgi:hypothetical protein
MMFNRPTFHIGKIALIVSVIFSIAGCGRDCRQLDEVKTLIEARINIGDSPDKVESVLKDLGTTYAYDDFQNRYQADFSNEACGRLVALSIYVSFDEKGRVSGVEAFKSYTAL